MGGGVGKVLQQQGVLVSSPTQADYFAWLACHHQSLNYLTDVSLVPAADPVAERQRGAEEHGASPRRGSMEGGVEEALHSPALSVSQFWVQPHSPLITSPSFSSGSY